MNTRAALLVVLAARPGTGKTTLARLLARDLGAAYLRVDAIEGPSCAAREVRTRWDRSGTSARTNWRRGRAPWAPRSWSTRSIRSRKHAPAGGQSVPSWAEVAAAEYVAWDEARDGPRAVVDMTDRQHGLAAALAYLSERIDPRAHPIAEEDVAGGHTRS